MDIWVASPFGDCECCYEHGYSNISLKFSFQFCCSLNDRDIVLRNVSLGDFIVV
jgi:hypothetical protein